MYDIDNKIQRRQQSTDCVCCCFVLDSQENDDGSHHGRRGRHLHSETHRDSHLNTPISHDTVYHFVQIFGSMLFR